LTILTGLALRTIQEELATMDAIGLVTGWSNGYHRFYRANRAHPLFANLCGIVQTSARLSCPKLQHIAGDVFDPKRERRIAANAPLLPERWSPPKFPPVMRRIMA